MIPILRAGCILPLVLIGCAPRHINDIVRVLSNPTRETPRHDSETTKAFAVEATADIVVAYNGETMTVWRDGPVTRKATGSPPSLTKLVHYFGSRARKNLVVVIFAKNVWSEARVKAEIQKISRYFFERGYHRIVIQQGLSSGRSTLSDTTRIPAADLKDLMPAARLEALVLQRSADIQVSYHRDGTMELLEPSKKISRFPASGQAYAPGRLTGYFDALPKKKFAVVVIEKQNWPDSRVKSEIAGLTEYFLARGCGRVAIQLTSAQGYWTVSDVRARRP